jgi:hypothetical protein
VRVLDWWTDISSRAPNWNGSIMNENAVSEHKGAVSTSVFCCVADGAIKM